MPRVGKRFMYSVRSSAMGLARAMISMSGMRFEISVLLVWGIALVISGGFWPMRSDVFSWREEARTNSDTGVFNARRPVRKKMYFRSSRMATQIERARMPSDSALGTSHMRGIVTWSCCKNNSTLHLRELG